MCLQTSWIYGIDLNWLNLEIEVLIFMSLSNVDGSLWNRYTLMDWKRFDYYYKINLFKIKYEYDCEIDFYWNFEINRLPVYTFVFTLSRFESDVHIS